MPTVALAIEPGPEGPDHLAAALRSGQPPVIARLVENRLVVDLRTVTEEEEEALLAALVKVAGA